MGSQGETLVYTCGGFVGFGSVALCEKPWVVSGMGHGLEGERSCGKQSQVLGGIGNSASGSGILTSCLA